MAGHRSPMPLPTKKYSPSPKVVIVRPVTFWLAWKETVSTAKSAPHSPAARKETSSPTAMLLAAHPAR